jgi:hypothetical protein
MSTFFTRASGVGLDGSGRVDFLRTPVSAEAEELTKSYFAGIYAADWDGGYDVDQYPSYGAGWRDSSRLPWYSSMRSGCTS